MLKACAIAVLAAVLSGCAALTSARKTEVEWPEPDATPPIMPSVEAGATLAAAAAVREMMRDNPFPDLFQGCSSPEQGLDVAVFKDPKSGLYYVVVHQHFSRCGGPRGRVLDWWYEYAVTPQGEVLGRAPPPAGDISAPSAPPGSSLPEQTVRPSRPHRPRQRSHLCFRPRWSLPRRHHLSSLLHQEHRLQPRPLRRAHERRKD
jgi:hypothetical protein